MKKIILIAASLLITQCAYKPVVDHRGSKGKEVAYRYNDDLETCTSLAKKNTNDFVEGAKITYNLFIRPQLLWLPDKWEYSYKPILKTCMEKRGHSIIK